MSINDEDYSSFLTYETWVSQIIALFCGFTFTAITLFLVELPAPIEIPSQIILFFLTTLFNIFQFLLLSYILSLAYCIQAVPPALKRLSSHARLHEWLTILGFYLWGFAILLMFVLWNLLYLALASGAMYVLFIILAYVSIWKPALELSHEMRSQSEK
jgi:hypothetical protein